MTRAAKAMEWLPCVLVGVGLFLAGKQPGLAASLSVIGWLMMAPEKWRDRGIACLCFVAMFGIGMKFGWSFGGLSPNSATRGIQLSPLELGSWILGISALRRDLREHGFFRTPVFAAAGWIFLVLIAAMVGLAQGHSLRAVAIDFRALSWIFAFSLLAGLDQVGRKTFWNTLALAAGCRIALDLTFWIPNPGFFRTESIPAYMHSEPQQFAHLALNSPWLPPKSTTTGLLARGPARKV